MSKEECIGSIGAWYQVEDAGYNKCVEVLDNYTQPYIDRIAQLESELQMLQDYLIKEGK